MAEMMPLSATDNYIVEKMHKTWGTKSTKTKVGIQD